MASPRVLCSAQWTVFSEVDHKIHSIIKELKTSAAWKIKQA